MACTISAGRAEPCKDIAAGIKRVLISNYTQGLEGSATFGGSDGEISAFASALTFYEYETLGETDSFDENMQTSRDNGTTFVEVSGTVVLRKQTAADRSQLNLMGKGRFQIITEDYNGNYKLYGLENGCDVNVQAQSGAAMGDLQGYTLTVSAKETELAHFVESSIIDDTTNTVVTTA